MVDSTTEKNWKDVAKMDRNYCGLIIAVKKRSAIVIVIKNVNG